MNINHEAFIRKLVSKQSSYTWKYYSKFVSRVVSERMAIKSGFVTFTTRRIVSMKLWSKTAEGIEPIDKKTGVTKQALKSYDMVHNLETPAALVQSAT